MSTAFSELWEGHVVKDHQDELHGHLANVPILAGLSRRQATKLLSGSKQIKHAAGHEIAVEGQGALALHLILDGTAQVSIRGKQIRQLGSGDYFGELSLIDGRPRSATVVAETALHTLAIPHSVFQNLLRDDPDFARGSAHGAVRSGPSGRKSLTQRRPRSAAPVQRSPRAFKDR